VPFIKFLLLFLILIPLTAYSRNIHVAGKLYDSKTYAGLPSANDIMPLARTMVK